MHVNYFLIDGRLYLIDLPGYGFARVPQSEKERWARLMESFFADTEACDLGVLIVDARHRPTEADRQMADWYRGSGMDFLVAANKMDKLKKSEREGQLQLVRETLALGEGTDVIPFSAESGEGREALLRGILNRL